jgi:hypothetical protein
MCNVLEVDAGQSIKAEFRHFSTGLYTESVED